MARSDSPPDATHVTDAVDPVLAEATELIGRDRAAHGELIAALRAEPQPVVREWLRSVLVPSVHLGVSEPSRIFDHPAVSIQPDELPVRPAVSLGLTSAPSGSLIERHRFRKAPWTALPTWFDACPQASSELTAWPRGTDDQPLRFILQADLEGVESNVYEAEYATVGLPNQGVLQIFADVPPRDGVSGDDMRQITHRVLVTPSHRMRDQAIPTPKAAAGGSRRPRFAVSDTMVTLPRTDDLPAYGVELLAKTRRRQPRG